MTRFWVLAAFSGTVAGFGAVPTVKQANLPLTFEPNRGQAPVAANFVARGTGYYLTLDRTGSRMLLRQGEKSAEIRTRLAGSARQQELRSEGALPGHSSYFRGNDASKWITGIPNYSRVKAQGVYPGIDLVYYGTQNQLEYDFVVAPHADPKLIRLAFDGVARVRTNETGDLILETAAGEILEHKPVVYQTIAGVRHSVHGSFRVTGRNLVRFQLGKYNQSAELTIDPVLVYSSFLGGTDTDAGNSVAADGAANMYMTGVTYSTAAGDADVLVRKISADGTTFLYNADLGGSGDDFGNGIAIDVNGYAFVGGRTSSTDFPTANAYQGQNFGANNAYVLRLNQSGNALIFSTYLGGNNDDRGYAVAVDPQGSVYLAGETTSDNFPTSSGAFQTARKGGADVFAAKFAYNGSLVYSTFIGGGSDDIANGIAVDSNGNAYVAGDTNSDSFPQVNAPYQHSRHGGLEGFVTEVNSGGTGLVFSTFIGGSGDDSCGGIAVDPKGNIYVVGTTTTDNSFSIPGKSYNTSYNGGDSDIFVAKYLPSGQNIAWTTFLGSHGADEGNAIATDANGNVYIAGDTDSSQYPVTRDAVQSGRGGGFDAVVSVLDTNGQNLVYSTFYGGSGDDSASGIALDQYFEVYLTGYTQSGDLAISTGAVQSAAGGGDMDAFLAKISVYGSAVPGTSPSVSGSQVSAFDRGLTDLKDGSFAQEKVAAGGGVGVKPMSRRERLAAASNRKPVR